MQVVHIQGIGGVSGYEVRLHRDYRDEAAVRAGGAMHRLQKRKEAV